MTKEFHLKLMGVVVALSIMWLCTILGLGTLSFIAWELPWHWPWNGEGRFLLVCYWILCLFPSSFAGAAYLDHSRKQLKKQG